MEGNEMMRYERMRSEQSPPRVSPPPPPPPPVSVAQRSTVDVTGATEALVVGPDDVLIVVFPEYTSVRDLHTVRDRFRDTGLRDDQYVLIAGAAQLGKVQRDGGRTYVRPKGTTGPRCDVCGEFISEWAGPLDDRGQVRAMPCGHEQIQPGNVRPKGTLDGYTVDGDPR